MATRDGHQEFSTTLSTGTVCVDIPSGLKDWEKEWLLDWLRLVLTVLERRFATNRGADVAPASLPKEERSMNTTDEAKPAETPATEAAAPPTSEAPASPPSTPPAEQGQGN